jgi:oligopeptide transport system ATP-binding protein
MADALLSVKGLSKYFPVIKGVVRARRVGEIKAVDGVSFDVSPGETLGLVGESGCGKTTTGRLLLRLLEPSAGQVCYRGVELTQLKRRDMDRYRRKLQIIFQDPYASLNPRITVGEAIGEPLIAHGLADAKAARERALHLLDVVGLAPFHYNRYPHEFSGGQRQRVGIARALVLEPEFIVADEPVSALDVSIQAQIINLLERIQAEFGLTFLFISHDLGVIRHISDRVLVMYRSPPASIHAGPAVSHPICEAWQDEGAHPPQRRRPKPVKPAFRVPLPHTLSQGHATVQNRRARLEGGCPWALCGVPFALMATSPSSGGYGVREAGHRGRSRFERELAREAFTHIG